MVRMSPDRIVAAHLPVLGLTGSGLMGTRSRSAELNSPVPERRRSRRYLPTNSAQRPLPRAVEAILDYVEARS